MTKHISQACSDLKGTVNVPGDKSISHRSLILASQVKAVTRVSGLLEGEDVLNTAKALRQLGVRIDQLGNGQWRVHGVGLGRFHESSEDLDMGNAGTGARLMMGLLAPYPFTSFFTGDASLCSRPMKRVITPLEQMGATFVSKSGDRLPLAMTGSSELKPIEYKLPVPSAQVKSAILLAGLNTEGTTTVIETEATRDHTENMLESFGFKIEREKLADDSIKISVLGRQEIETPHLRLIDIILSWFGIRNQAPSYQIQVPSDPSSAAFLAVAALITESSEITISNVCMNPLRTGLFTTLLEMGANIEYVNQRTTGGEPVADIKVKSSKLKGTDVPAERAPSMIDEYPILAVAASFAEGATTMRGLKELRVKESDRFNAIVKGLESCGVRVEVDGDDMVVHGSNEVKGGGHITTNLDHRICMSFLVMGMATKEPVTIDSAEPINTSFPGFIDMCNMLGATIHQERRAKPRSMVIAVDGQAASGKGTLARRLAEHYELQYLDTGSLYRAVGLKVLESGGSPEDKDAAIKAAKTISIADLSAPKLRQEKVGQAASIVSAYPEVRSALLDFQREVANNPGGAVLDGRDIGTVVCPDAAVKFFLTASMDARATRRHKELSSQGIEVVYQSVYDDLKERDERDAKRDIAPMKPAKDAMQIDTSNMNADSVFEKAKALVVEKS